MSHAIDWAQPLWSTEASGRPRSGEALMGDQVGVLRPGELVVFDVFTGAKCWTVDTRADAVVSAGAGLLLRSYVPREGTTLSWHTGPEPAWQVHVDGPVGQRLVLQAHGTDRGFWLRNLPTGPTLPELLSLDPIDGTPTHHPIPGGLDDFANVGSTWWLTSGPTRGGTPGLRVRIGGAWAVLEQEPRSIAHVAEDGLVLLHTTGRARGTVEWWPEGASRPAWRTPYHGAVMGRGDFVWVSLGLTLRKVDRRTGHTRWTVHLDRGRRIRTIRPVGTGLLLTLRGAEDVLVDQWSGRRLTAPSGPVHRTLEHPDILLAVVGSRVQAHPRLGLR